MWKAFGALLFNLLASVGAYFAVRKGGKDSVKLNNAQQGLKNARKARENAERAARMSDAELDRRLREDDYK